MSKLEASPLVSVITIFLNAERFLGEAVESVLAQTYSHWELLLVDDGSTDASSSIARSYAARCPERIRYLEHPGHANRGKSTSRNVGLRQSAGEFIAFLDADDVFLPDKLARQVAMLTNRPTAGMVYGRTLYWFGWTGRSADLRRDFVGRLGVRAETSFQPPDLVTHFLKRAGAVPCICGVLVRRQAVMDVGGFDESIQHMYEDQVLLAKLCLASCVFVEGGCGELYRQHPDSSSNEAMRRGEYHPWRLNPARAAYLSWLSRYATQLGIGDVAFWSALHGELRLYRYPLLGYVLSPVLHAARAVATLLADRSTPEVRRPRSP
jgi:glycosyltransferase involved in cell wall biosynthesis